MLGLVYVYTAVDVLLVDNKLCRVWFIYAILKSTTKCVRSGLYIYTAVDILSLVYVCICKVETEFVKSGLRMYL